MNTKQRMKAIVFIIVSLLMVGLFISGCRQASGKDFTITDFDAVHLPVDNGANTYLIFGNIPVSPPAEDLSPDLAIFLGRWEGYDYSLPVKEDYKIVLVIQNISDQGGKAYLWLGTNIQYPSMVQEIDFQVTLGAVPTIEFRTRFGSANKTVRLVYDSEQKILKNPDNASRLVELSQGQTFYVYKDYELYLSSKQIFPKTYQNQDLQKYGVGYLLYLPDGYEDAPSKTWPLIFCLHGAGDCEDNIYLLAKASPFMMIRERMPLPFIIIAPLLTSSCKLFPIEY